MTNLQKLMHHLPDDADCAVIVSPVNRRYFTSMKSLAGVLVVTKEKAYFLIDFRYYERAKAVCKDCDVILSDSSEQLKEIFQRHAVKTVAVESNFMTLHTFLEYQRKYEDIRWLESPVLDKAIESLRIVKTKEEINSMLAAQKLTDDAFFHILDFIKEGKTEREIALELEYTMLRHGAEAVSFDTIVVSGKHSSLPHGVPTEKKISKGEFITMDFGAVIQGYHSDMTRTVSIGEPTDEMLHVYNTVLQAQIKALASIQPKAECSAIDKIARDYINREGYEGKFGHGLGHGVGMEIHESPSFSPRCDTVLHPGMVLTVEPGIYIENTFGVRIEDMIVVTDTGYLNLTKSPKNLIVL